jgi:RHH-type proline utilization regulon transcriptional repressor/proline dehydrogenase/delta 1-pyrroline-5-carboxylate dehydrogenase
MEDSQYMLKAKKLLKKPGVLNVEERREAAIALAALILNESRRVQTLTEHQQMTELSRMLTDERGKAFFTHLTDQSFRSKDSKRVADQVLFLLKKFGIPQFLSFSDKLKLTAFKWTKASLLVPLMRRALRKKAEQVILPGERRALRSHIERRKKEGVRVNLNRLGEAIMGEEEARSRLNLCLSDLADKSVSCISVKISSIYSQIDPLAFEETLAVLMERYRELLRAANGKFVYLDMEEYRDLQLTVELFRRVLNEPEFFSTSAGIVLQSYIPESFLLQQELTLFAIQRVMRGGAPIKIRLVKGANLAMEQVLAAVNSIEQAPFSTKSEVDASFKRMLEYALKPEHVKAANVAVASHNLFDISYALLLRAENGVQERVSMEMLEGMADPIRRVVQELSGAVLLYCPAAKKEEFQYAMAYLMRRLDENTAPQNFLRHAFEMIPGTNAWYNQTSQFSLSCHMAKSVSFSARRGQNRLLEPKKIPLSSPFSNEADTDFTQETNRKFIQEIVNKWKEKQIPLIEKTEGFKEEVPVIEVEKRAEMLIEAAHLFRKARGDLIGAMMLEGKKTAHEADVEVSEAIDFIEYYARSILELDATEGIKFSPKGRVLIAPPWNFPCSIPTGCVAAALAAGNKVLFKPAPEAVFIGHEVAKLFFEAGFSQMLDFLNVDEEKAGASLIKDERINLVALTGATETAKNFYKMRPDLDLIAETGGKNAIIVSAMSDWDLAIKDIVLSAFPHAGQKCSACSLAILEREVFDSEKFRRQLKDAAMSLHVGFPFDLKTKVNPLIHAPSETLKRALTTLDEGEEWLLEPKEVGENLYSPGIKLGVKAGSFSHQTEFFGPVLGVMRADNFEHALELANGTPYGLTSGLHSLDVREHRRWIEKIEAGNLYINRTITGAVVRRQPFGGCKASSFGPATKAGGPNALLPYLKIEEVAEPTDLGNIKKRVAPLMQGLSSEDFHRLSLSAKSYAYAFDTEFSKKHDPSLLQGQDNLFYYRPKKNVVVLFQEEDKEVDLMCTVAAALTAGADIEVSSYKSLNLEGVEIVHESTDQLITRLENKSVIALSKPPMSVFEACHHISYGPVLSHGRFELLKYMREVAISYDYHRYGSLAEREGETRAPLKEII